MRRSTTAWTAKALLAVAALALGAAPLAALAQDAAKPAPITKESRDKGMKAAPAIAKAAGLSCEVNDAYFIGTSSGKDKGDIYEVACTQGLGYVLIAGAKPTAYDCLATRTQPTLACRLPGNANAVEQFKPTVAQSGAACAVKDARYVGASPTVKVYEVTCQQGPGYLIEAPAPGQTTPLQAIPCAAAVGQSTQCTLTTKADIDAYIAALAAKSGQTCQVSANRYVGTNKNDGQSYFEVGCAQGPGFIIAADKDGAYKSSMSCPQAQAQGLGACTLTSAAVLTASQTATYTQQAKAAGFNCDVSTFRVIGLDPHHNEVVELACSNRPDGAVAVLPAATGGRTTIVDCVMAGQFGAQAACTLTQPTALYAKYTAALRAKGRSTCTVSGAHYLGRSGTGTDFVETACTDGRPGYVMELTSSGAAASLLSCGQARASGLTCILPTNQPHL